MAARLQLRRLAYRIAQLVALQGCTRVAKFEDGLLDNPRATDISITNEEGRCREGGNAATHNVEV